MRIFGRGRPRPAAAEGLSSRPERPGGDDEPPGDEDPAPLGSEDAIISGIEPGSSRGRARFAELAAEVARIGALTADELAGEHPIQHAASLGYSPSAAEFMDLIQSSSLALDTAELELLEQNAFVISSRQQFPNFMRGYAAIYMEEKATAASGTGSVTLFGVPREEDFSQFRPRGHYTEEPFASYFRAMMWLGRVDFRLIETRSDGSVVFRRPQYEAMLALHELMDARSTELWSNIDDVVRAFVGESDSMTVPQVASLSADLGGLGAAREASDESVVQAINDGGYGEQQIASYLITNATGERIPLNRSFLAACGGHRGLGPAPAQHPTRFLGAAAPRHAALRQAVVHRRRAVRVSGRLRRAQSRVLPALVRFAERGGELVNALPTESYLSMPLQSYFSSFAATVGTLAQMAEQQRSGEPFSAAQLAFINDAVRVDTESAGCVTTEVPNGWYASLFFNRAQAIQQDLTIADVHTQPTDEAGNPVGKVLHVGTAFPRLMTVTIDTCVGPRAYVGMAYSYHELITENFVRLNDEEWTARVTSDPISEVPWARSIIAP